MKAISHQAFNRNVADGDAIPFIGWLLVTLALWCFVGIHAFAMNITHDEAYSFYLIKTNYFRALFGSANNHWLNSFFMKVSSLLLGDEPGFLRLHNVLAFPFFSWGIWKLSQFIPQKPMRYVCCALVLFNPYLLDFFSLARGYSMAITFQAWCLFFFVKAASQPFHYRTWFRVWLMGLLMVASNLSYLYTLLPIAAVFFGLIIHQTYRLQQKPTRPEKRIMLLFAIILAGTIIDLLFIKYYGHDLEFGSREGLIGAVFGSIWTGSLYRSPLTLFSGWMGILSFILLCVSIAWYSIQAFQQQRLPTGWLLGIPVAGLLVLGVVFHIALQSPFLVSRTALQWYVPGMLLLCFFFSSGLRTAGTPAFRWLPVTGSVLIVIGLAAHYITSVRQESCFEWPAFGNSKQIIYDLYAQRPKAPYLGALEGVYRNYYRLVDSTLRPLPLTGVIKDTPTLMSYVRRADYIVFNKSITKRLQQDSIAFEVIKTYSPLPYQLMRIR